jgi:hypothetical protein
MNARVGPVLIPAIQIGLSGLEGFEAEPLQRRPLRVADAGFAEEQEKLFAAAQTKTAWLYAYVASTLAFYCGLAGIGRNTSNDGHRVTLARAECTAHFGHSRLLVV